MLVPLLAVTASSVAVIHHLVATDHANVRRGTQSVLPLLLLRSHLGDEAALQAFTGQKGSAAAYARMYAATRAEFSAARPTLVPASVASFGRAQASLANADGLMRTWLAQSTDARHYSLAVTEKAYVADVAAAKTSLERAALAARHVNVASAAAQGNLESDAMAEIALLVPWP